MIQALTILLDSLRMLRASKMFWISLWISTLVALGYASIGFTESGISLGFGLIDFKLPIIRRGTEEAAQFYRLLFTDVIVRFWLGWLALVLALISTCSIFPQFLQAGSIDLVLSKPIRRTQLFLLKYLGGLSFVALQTLLFCGVAYLAIGFRLDIWSARVFWAVPVITFSFSLIFCVSALIGLLTRSTVFSLMGSLLFWALTLCAQWSEDALYKMAYVLPELGLTIDLAAGGIGSASESQTNELKDTYQKISTVVAILPKTRECTLMLKRLIVFENPASARTGIDLSAILSGNADAEMERLMEQYEQRHSMAYLIFSSLAFEAIVLGLAIAVFQRRDY
jgi:ABC-type transport system involved in multi-copper enzyme maturation permease subunit